MNRPVHFDIVTDNPDETEQFYNGVFGWEFKKWDGPITYWMISTGKGPGIDGGMALKEHGMGVQTTIEVSGIDEYMNKIKEHGGKILTEKMPIVGVGFMAIFEDSEGNKFEMMENDENAKMD